MRADPLLLALLLAGCHRLATPEEQVERSANVQRRIEAVPPDGDASGQRIAIDNDAATPTRARP